MIFQFFGSLPKSVLCRRNLSEKKAVSEGNKKSCLIRGVHMRRIKKSGFIWGKATYVKKSHNVTCRLKIVKHTLEK